MKNSKTKEGYVTIMSELTDTIAWKDEEGAPVFYRSKTAAKREIADDMREYKRQVKEGERGKDEIPDPDEIGYGIQISEDLFQIQDIDRNDLFVWDRNDI